MFKDKNGQFSAGKLIAFIAAIVAVIIVAASCVTGVPAGHTGVVVNMGRVSETVLQEGFHFKTPFVQEIVQIDNRIVKLEVATDAFSKDLHTVSTVLAVNYRIAKDMSYSIYKEVGSNFESVLVMPAVNEVLKAVVAKYTASDLVASRSEVSVMLDEELNGKLNARGIFIEDLNIIDWDFSAEYIAAVEAKQVAEQNLIKTKTEQEEQIVIAEAEAKKKRIAAEADSDTAIIAAKAEAERIRIEAEATAEANRTIAESLNDAILRNKTIEKWDGQLPRVTAGEGSTHMISVPMEKAYKKEVFIYGQILGRSQLRPWRKLRRVHDRHGCGRAQLRFQREHSLRLPRGRPRRYAQNRSFSQGARRKHGRAPGLSGFSRLRAQEPERERKRYA